MANVIQAFNQSSLRNIIRDISFSASGSKSGNETVSVNMNLVFFETIKDGVPDAGLIMPEVKETPASD